MSRFWSRYTPPLPTWHVLCSWPDGRSRVVAIGRTKGEATLRLRRYAGRLIDGRTAMDLLATPRGFAVSDGGRVHEALSIELCEIEECTACAASASAAR